MVVLAGLMPSLVSQCQGVAQCGVAKGNGGCVGHCSRHVGHSIVEYAVDGINRLVVCRGVGCLEASALVDGYIYEDSARLHFLEHIACDEVRGLGSWNQCAAHNDVGIGKFADYVVG